MANSKKGEINRKNFNTLLKEKMEELEKEYLEEKARLEAEIEKLEKMLADLEKEREAERKELLRQIENLNAYIKDLEFQFNALIKEFKKLTFPPLGYGYVISVVNPDSREVDILNQDGGRYRVFVAKTVDINKLKRGQPVLLNQALHIIDLGSADLRGHIAIVREIKGQHAIIGRDIGGETTALISEGLELEPGDQVIIDRSYSVILAKIEREEQYEELLVKEVEPITFENIGGLDSQIEALKKAIIRPYVHPEWYREFNRQAPKGILLVGPPGTGKTMLVKALYNYLKNNTLKLFGKKKEVALFHVAGPELQSKWVGETEYYIRKLFNVARKEAKKGKISIIFFDEAESMFPVRSHSAVDRYKNDYVTQFTSEMQGLETDPRQIVIVILASNRGELLDPAVIRVGRLDIKIEIPRPDKKASADIFGKYILTEFTFDQKYFQGFTDEKGNNIKFQTKEEVRDYLIWQAVEYLFTEEKFGIITFGLRNGETRTLHFKDVLSGAIIKSIVDQAVDLIMDRREQTTDDSIGMSLEILKEAIDEKFKQEKILIEKLVNENEWQSILAVMGIKSIDIESVEWTGGKKIEIEYGMRY